MQRDLLQIFSPRLRSLLEPLAASWSGTSLLPTSSLCITSRNRPTRPKPAQTSRSSSNGTSPVEIGPHPLSRLKCCRRYRPPGPAETAQTRPDRPKPETSRNSSIRPDPIEIRRPNQLSKPESVRNIECDHHECLVRFAPLTKRRVRPSCTPGKTSPDQTQSATFPFD